MMKKTEYTKRECIDALQWLFGFSKKEAEKTYKNSTESYRRTCVETFKCNAKRSLAD